MILFRHFASGVLLCVLLFIGFDYIGNNVFPVGETKIQMELDIQEAVFRHEFNELEMWNWHPMLKKLQPQRGVPKYWIGLATPDPSGNFADRFKGDFYSEFSVEKTPYHNFNIAPVGSNGIAIGWIRWNSPKHVTVYIDNGIKRQRQSFDAYRSLCKWSVIPTPKEPITYYD